MKTARLGEEDTVKILLKWILRKLDLYYVNRIEIV
jgi:hypothetical protein